MVSVTIFLLLVGCFPFLAAKTVSVGNSGASSVPIPPPVEPLPNITFYIEQKGMNEEFHPRTRIQLIPKSDGKHGLLYLDKNTIVGNDVKYFKSLIQNQELYTIRIRSEKEDMQGHFVMASIPVVSSDAYFTAI